MKGKFMGARAFLELGVCKKKGVRFLGEII